WFSLPWPFPARVLTVTLGRGWYSLQVAARPPRAALAHSRSCRVHRRPGQPPPSRIPCDPPHLTGALRMTISEACQERPMSEINFGQPRPASLGGTKAGILHVLIFAALLGIAGLSFAFAGLMAHPQKSFAMKKNSTSLNRL